MDGRVGKVQFLGESFALGASSRQKRMEFILFIYLTLCSVCKDVMVVLTSPFSVSPWRFVFVRKRWIDRHVMGTVAS